MRPRELEGATVRLTIGSRRVGTGFFVTPNVVATCAHVIGEATTVTVESGRLSQNGTVIRCERQDSVDGTVFPDIALIRVDEQQSGPLMLDKSCRPGDRLYAWGFPRLAGDGDSVQGTCEGFRNFGPMDTQRLIKFKETQVTEGFSGSPVLNLRTGAICGMLKRTRDESSPAGGYAVRVAMLLRDQDVASTQKRIHAPRRQLPRGLISPRQFREDYWRERRNEPGMATLWDDPARAKLLTGPLVGRAKELADFGAFLADPAAGILHLKGWPGTGKSRLMLAFARIAVARGHRAFFVSNDVRDLAAALRGIRPGGSTVLLWDDYRGDNQAALQVLLDLDMLGIGTTIKRVITTWPSYNVLGLGRNARPPLAMEKDLFWSVTPAALIAHAQGLLPAHDQETVTRLVLHTEAHPTVTLHAVALVLNGGDITNLPTDILAWAYDRIIQDVTQVRGLEHQPAIGRALLAMALVGIVDFGNALQRRAMEACGVRREYLGVLVQQRTVSHERESQAYALAFDGLRAHIVRRALDYAYIEVLSGSVEEVTEVAGPLLTEWLDAIWSICLLATEKLDNRAELQNGLLTALDTRLAGIDDDTVTRVASRLVNATTVEPHPGRALTLADRLQRVLADHPGPELALRYAQALRNITTLEQESERREALADRITRLLDAYPTADIAVELAKALLNATAVAPTRERCEEIAAHIGRLRQRFDNAAMALQHALATFNGIALPSTPTPRLRQVAYDAHLTEAAARRIGELLSVHRSSDIALVQARALLMATVHTSTAARCTTLADVIDDLLQLYPLDDIAVIQAQALANASSKEVGADHCQVLADRIARLRLRYDTPRIDVEQARALLNASALESDSSRCVVIVGRIEALGAANPESPELATIYAQSLRNFTRCDITPDECEAVATKIAALLARHKRSEIAHALVAVLFNATIDQTDPRRCEEIANQIERLRAQFDSPSIALHHAQALFAAMAGQPLSRHDVLLTMIQSILDRHRTHEIASVMASALDMTNRTFRDSPSRSDRIKALEQLRRIHRI